MYEYEDGDNLEGISDDDLFDIVVGGVAPEAIVPLALNIIRARRHRIAGRIEQAARCERVVDAIYKTLSDHLRW